jgi:hypothetical protein
MSEFEQKDAVGNPGTNAPDRPTGDAAPAGYMIGYKRPPQETRFQPGRSGNPKGRPKGRSNHRTMVNRVMNEKVSVRQGDKTRRMSKFEAVIQAQANKGMKGDARSAAMVLRSKSMILKPNRLKWNPPSVGRATCCSTASTMRFFPERRRSSWQRSPKSATASVSPG